MPAAEATWAAEETQVFLPTSGQAGNVSLAGRSLGTAEDEQRTPYLLRETPGGLYVRLTDWVGRLEFSVEDGRGVTVHPCYVYPAKLSPDPKEAFAALGRMVDDLSGVTAPQIDFPREVLPSLEPGLRPPPAAALEDLAAQAWALWQRAKQTPRAPARPRPRLDSSGTVPDRVDWDWTLRHWGQGGFPAHVARDLPPLPPAPGLAALHGLWQALLEAAHHGQPQLVRRFQAAQTALPALPVGYSPPGPLDRHARALTEQVRSLSEQAVGLPRGHTRMAALYELWAMHRFCSVVGATEGEFRREPGGLYSGRMTGPGAEVQLNLGLSFSGVGQGWQLLQPDILLLRGQQALVADVKYRPVHRFTPSQMREVNDQLLRYMGLSHAGVGLILWPGDPVGSRLFEGRLPGACPDGPAAAESA
ncbi:hypothetical protein ACFP81_12680 [Deinococcus lacus]|uniref:Uncharacterized protein n=1 Tax=Deinococcus lacus TaxID=392561 RepID=A0ABW1YEM5_9DEIO